MTFHVGSNVWIVDRGDGDTKHGEIESCSATDAVIFMHKDASGCGLGPWEKSGDKQTVPLSHLLQSQKSFPETGYDDMSHLENLNEQELLRNLQARFKQDYLYTYTGPTLVAINAFKRSSEYRNGDPFSDEVFHRYRGKEIESNDPHIYAISDKAFTQCTKSGINQAIIITGESGAGKSFSCGKVLNYLAAVSALASGNTATSGPSVADKILAANPILEALGNSKMPRNDDSSRFGKLFQIFYVSIGSIARAMITPYLIEKSRVCVQSRGERGYHVFYMLLKGSTDEQKKQYSLLEPEKYSFLNRHLGKSGTADKDDEVIYEIRGADGVLKKDDANDFRELIKSFATCGVAPDLIDSILSVFSAVLLLGNVSLVDNGDGFAKIENESLISGDIARLLKLDGGELVKYLKGSTVVKDYGLMQIGKALKARTSLAKALYCRMFDWIVEVINEGLGTTASQLSIGVLDIFGFECCIPNPPVAINSFEQLCINYCNEKLQNLFVEHIFMLEQNEYRSEGIDVGELKFENNIVTLKLIDAAKEGILSLCDEQVKLGARGDDKQLLDSLKKMHHKKHEKFDLPPVKKSVTSFIVKHYAEEVEYEISDFVEKNADKLGEDLVVLMHKSGHTRAVGNLFTIPDPNDKQTKGGLTVSASFKQSLVALIQVLKGENSGGCNPTFIRCIKPNKPKVPNLFEPPLVLNQIRYSGMIASLEIRRSGFPQRLDFHHFYEKYRALSNTATNFKDLVEDMKSKNALDAEAKHWRIGKTKFFMKDKLNNHLEHIRATALGDSARVIQVSLLSLHSRRQYQKISAITRLVLPRLRSGIERRRYAVLLKSRMEELERMTNKSMLDWEDIYGHKIANELAAEKAREIYERGMMKYEYDFSVKVMDANAGERFMRGKESALLAAEDAYNTAGLCLLPYCSAASSSHHVESFVDDHKDMFIQNYQNRLKAILGPTIMRHDDNWISIPAPKSQLESEYALSLRANLAAVSGDDEVVDILGLLPVPTTIQTEANRKMGIYESDESDDRDDEDDYILPPIQAHSSSAEPFQTSLLSEDSSIQTTFDSSPSSVNKSKYDESLTTRTVVSSEPIFVVGNVNGDYDLWGELELPSLIGAAEERLLSILDRQGDREKHASYNSPPKFVGAWEGFPGNNSTTMHPSLSSLPPPPPASSLVPLPSSHHSNFASPRLTTFSNTGSPPSVSDSSLPTVILNVSYGHLPVIRMRMASDILSALDCSTLTSLVKKELCLALQSVPDIVIGYEDSDGSLLLILHDDDVVDFVNAGVYRIVCIDRNSRGAQDASAA